MDNARGSTVKRPFAASGVGMRLMLVVLVTAIPAIGLIGYNFVRDYHDAVANAKSELVRLTASVANTHATIIANSHAVLVGLINRRSIEEHDIERCASDFGRIVVAATDLLNVGVASADGDLFCTALPIRVNLADRPWFKRALADNALVIGDYQVGRVTRLETINVALGARTQRGEPVVGVAVLPVARIQERVLNQNYLPPDSRFLAIDRNDRVIERWPEPTKWVGLSAAGAPIVKAMHDKSDAVIETTTLDGVKSVVATAPVIVGNEPVFYVAVSLPVAVVTGAPLSRLVVNLGGFMAAALAALGLAWLIAEHSVRRPIARIAQAATRLAAGQTDARVGAVGGAREIVELGNSFDGMVASLEERTARLAEASEKFREVHDRLDAAFNASPAAIIALDTRGKVILWNLAAQRIYGWSEEDVIGKPFSMIPDSERARAASLFDRSMSGESFLDGQGVHLSKDGRRMEVTLAAAPLRDGEGRQVGALYVINDVTHKIQTERQLQQAQKMEAVGQLTGGIAHDFNNLLGVAIGNIDLIGERVADDPTLKELVQSSLGACLRGADLTRQLLAFSRQQPLSPESIDPVDALKNMTRLLGRTLGEQVTLRLQAKGETWPIIADRTQLETAVLNLAVNARDAMPEGGTLSIEIVNARLDENYADRQVEVVPGDYVEIAVTDTGSGMAPEIVARVFEPFFTTKETGKGTGLGLSMVYGFIKQSGGHIKIYSEIGQGTTIKLWLPRAPAKDAQDEQSPAEFDPAAARGSETVLVVEDNADIRKVVLRQMAELGYSTLEAGDADAALVLLRNGVRIDLLFTDVVMPGGKDGPALAREALVLKPGIKILFTSGFTQAGVSSNGKEPLTAPLLSKPYRKQQLAAKLREVLDSGL